MDISRSIFPVSYPHLRLDAGTHATMGVGMGYAMAAHIAYNGLGGAGGEALVGDVDGVPGGRKKVVCLEGDSEFGFSGMEVETMSRLGMDVLIFVINNRGVYHGDADEEGDWNRLRDKTVRAQTEQDRRVSANKGLRSTSLGFQTRYQDMATMVGGLGLEARTIEEVEEVTRKGWRSGKGCVVNVIVGKGEGGKLEFRWQASGKKNKKAEAEMEPEKGKGGRGVSFE